MKPQAGDARTTATALPSEATALLRTPPTPARLKAECAGILLSASGTAERRQSVQRSPPMPDLRHSCRSIRAANGSCNFEEVDVNGLHECIGRDNLERLGRPASA